MALISIDPHRHTPSALPLPRPRSVRYAQGGGAAAASSPRASSNETNPASPSWRRDFFNILLKPAFRLLCVVYIAFCCSAPRSTAKISVTTEQNPAHKRIPACRRASWPSPNRLRLRTWRLRGLHRRGSRMPQLGGEKERASERARERGGEGVREALEENQGEEDGEGESVSLSLSE